METPEKIVICVGCGPKKEKKPQPKQQEKTIEIKEEQT